MTPLHEYFDVVRTRNCGRFRSFSWAITHCFWAPGPISGAHDPYTRILRRRQNSSFQAFLAVFVGYNTLFFLARSRFQGPMTPLHEYFDVVRTRNFGRFRSFSWPITHCFWAPGPISGAHDPDTRILRRRQNSSFQAFLAVFVEDKTRLLY